MLNQKRIVTIAVLAGTSLCAAHAEESVTTTYRAVEETDTTSVATTSSDDDGLVHPGLTLNHFSIFYGPSLKDPGSNFQPNPQGAPDQEKPLLVKNYSTAGYNLNEQVAVAATAYWQWIPVVKNEVRMKDPYAKVSHNSLITTDNFNLYGDLRVHFPVTDESRNQDMLSGIQTFHIATYVIPNSRFTLGSYTSARLNIFGSQGFGNDLELYWGPNLSYQMHPSVALTLLYEMGMSHVYGEKPLVFKNDGTDLEPGISWEVTKGMFLNPYLNFYPGDKISLASTSVGMTLSWQLL